MTTLTTVGGRHFDRIEAWFWGDSFGGGSTNLRMPEFVRWSESNPLPDLLFLGSSTCYRGIDPHPFEVAGLSSFNLCSSAQPLSTSQFVLDFALEYVTPQRIVLDLYKGVWLSDGFNSRRDFIINNNLAYADAFQEMALET
ncbi:MAG: hypothetical protein P8M07_09060, partial [Flavobacteriales bacterium]|nr:hypothetical protein [Flavobacteriales bacterium]